MEYEKSRPQCGDAVSNKVQESSRVCEIRLLYAKCGEGIVSPSLLS